MQNLNCNHKNHKYKHRVCTLNKCLHSFILPKFTGVLQHAVFNNYNPISANMESPETVLASGQCQLGGKLGGEGGRSNSDKDRGTSL